MSPVKTARRSRNTQASRNAFSRRMPFFLGSLTSQLASYPILVWKKEQIKLSLNEKSRKVREAMQGRQFKRTSLLTSADDQLTSRRVYILLKIQSLCFSYKTIGKHSIHFQIFQKSFRTWLSFSTLDILRVNSWGSSVFRHQKTLPRQAVELPSLEIFKTCLDWATGSRWCCQSRWVEPDDIQSCLPTSAILRCFFVGVVAFNF